MSFMYSIIKQHSATGDNEDDGDGFLLFHDVSSLLGAVFRLSLVFRILIVLLMIVLSSFLIVGFLVRY